MDGGGIRCGALVGLIYDHLGADAVASAVDLVPTGPEADEQLLGQ